jgi:hypothetical protein
MGTGIRVSSWREQRKGSANSQRGAKRFIEELVARLRRAGATGTLVMRFDSGFWSKDILSTLERLGVSYTMAVWAAAFAGILVGQPTLNRQLRMGVFAALGPAHRHALFHQGDGHL